MENNCIVYRHIRLDKNEPFYIGIASNEKRPYTKINRNIHWHRIVNKTEYRVDILFDDLTWEDANEKEKEFIALYGRKHLGTGTLVNITDGGGGVKGWKNPMKGKKSNICGENHPMYGKTHSKESIEKMKINISKSDKRKISGKGINFDKNRNAWRCRIRVNKQNYYLGQFKTYEEALTARLEAEKKYWNNNA